MSAAEGTKDVNFKAAVLRAGEKPPQFAYLVLPGPDTGRVCYLTQVDDSLSCFLEDQLTVVLA